jgi:SAM-dependent methyltransferase
VSDRADAPFGAHPSTKSPHPSDAAELLPSEDIESCLQGERLYGDDFDVEQISHWHAEEKEAYAELGAKNANQYQYAYHAWNHFHAFRYFRGQQFQHAMGFGSAYGEEFFPIARNIGRITIVDPSDCFAQEKVCGVPATYVKPGPSGHIPIPAETFDLISCLGVLHHIPNVSFVVSELVRVLNRRSCIVMREPIVSMGDWRRPRRGLTKRERGIPLHLLKNIVDGAGLRILHQSLCAFPLTPRLFRWSDGGVYNNSVATILDALLSATFAWNVKYHARNFLQRLAPNAVFLILQKP